MLDWLVLASFLTSLPGVQSPSLRPTEVLRLVGGPLIAVVETPGSGVVAARVTVDLREGPSEAGYAGVLERLALERMETVARRLGARVDASRTPWGVTYTAVGAAADFEHLAWILREAVAEPMPDPLHFERTRSEARAGVDRLRETAHGTLRARLRDRAFPTLPALEGTAATLDSLTVDGLREFWGRTHQRSAMRFVVAGDVPSEAIQVAFAHVGSPDGRRAPPPEEGPTGLDDPDPQVLRRWYGEAHLAGRAGDPRPSVAARLAAELLSEEGEGYETWTELWEMEGWEVLVLTGAAYPAAADRMRRRIRSVVPTLETSVTEEMVERAKARIRQETLLAARTPWGLVTVIGRHLDATGDPAGAQRYLRALDDVDRKGLVAFLGRLLEQTPLRAEVTP